MALAYLFVWFWFACFFTVINNDNIYSFEYSSPIVHAQLSLDGDAQCLHINDSFQKWFLQKILEKEEYKINPLSFGNEEYLTAGQVGNDWGAYYESKLSAQGFAYFTFSEPSGSTFILHPSMLSYMDQLRYMESELDKHFVVIALNLYKRNQNIPGFKLKPNEIQYLSPDVELRPQIKADKKYILLFDSNDYYAFLSTFNNQVVKPQPLWELLSFSHTLLDDDYAKMGGNYVNFANYMYFSAITITTLGYGDIIPASTVSRVAVMVEVLLGVIIIGVYLTFLTNPTNKDKDEIKENEYKPNIS